MLFSVALFIFGIKFLIQTTSYRIAEHYAKGILSGIISAYQNSDLTFGGIKVHVNFRHDQDVLTVVPIFNVVKSEKNFRYNYYGIPVVCSVKYLKSEDAYEVSCQTR
jgi:small basic protein